MLQQITWTEYWTTAGILITLYYTAVMAIYYQKDILQLFSRPKNITHASEVQENQVQE